MPDSVVVITRDMGLTKVVWAALSGLGRRARRISVAGDLLDGLAAARLLGPPLVVIDDDVDGEGALAAIRELHRLRLTPHVVYVASHHTLDLERRVRRA